MSKSESEQPLLGWKQSFPSVLIRVRSGSCTEELRDLRETQQKGERSTAGVDPDFSPSSLQWSLPK